MSNQAPPPSLVPIFVGKSNSSNRSYASPPPALSNRWSRPCVLQNHMNESLRLSNPQCQSTRTSSSLQIHHHSLRKSSSRKARDASVQLISSTAAPFGRHCRRQSTTTSARPPVLRRRRGTNITQQKATARQWENPLRALQNDERRPDIAPRRISQVKPRRARAPSD